MGHRVFIHEISDEGGSQGRTYYRLEAEHGMHAGNRIERKQHAGRIAARRSFVRVGYS